MKGFIQGFRARVAVIAPLGPFFLFGATFSFFKFGRFAPVLCFFFTAFFKVSATPGNRSQTPHPPKYNKLFQPTFSLKHYTYQLSIAYYILIIKKTIPYNLLLFTYLYTLNYPIKATFVMIKATFVMIFKGYKSNFCNDIATFNFVM